MHQYAYYVSKKATDWQIVDARASGRFLGDVPEPRAGLRSGHITGSKNMPFSELINEDGTLKSDAELGKIFTQRDIDTTLPTINSCGSGMTACVVDLALRILGNEKSMLYDGSWTEYVSVKYFWC